MNEPSAEEKRPSMRCLMCRCTYLLVLKRLHELRHPAERQGEGQTGPSVAVRYIDALVAKISFPFCITADFILTKDVRD